MRAHLALPPLRAHAAAALLRRGALGPVRPRGHLAVIHYNKEEVTRAVNDHSRSFTVPAEGPYLVESAY